MERFKYEKRVHQKYKEGDIFTFKIGRRQYGFGKILIDVAKRRRTEEFKQNKNYGLANLMGPALIVKVYHKISDNINADIDELERGLSLPPQAVMDNRIYYGEYKIIGNRKVTNRDLDDAANLNQQKHKLPGQRHRIPSIRPDIQGTVPF